VQSFTLEKLLLFGSKQLQSAEKVYAVYEAGPLGYVLYRKLRELGIEAMVCAPECLEAGSKRKHNKIDVSKLTGRLYSYLSGDRYALQTASDKQRYLTALQIRHSPLSKIISIA
jgi:transposase